MVVLDFFIFSAYTLSMVGLFLLVFFSFFSLSCNIHTDPYDRLYEAIRKSDEKEVQSIMASGLDLNPDNKNWTPLMIAALRTDINMVDMLLKNGADVQKRNNKGQTPLHLAARWGKPEMAVYLIDRGAFLESRDWLSWTPLMWASLRGRNEMVQVLLKNGANVNVRDIDGNTPLILAAWHGHTETVKILLSAGGNKFVINAEKKSACDVAREKKFFQTLQILGSCK